MSVKCNIMVLHDLEILMVECCSECQMIVLLSPVDMGAGGA